MWKLSHHAQRHSLLLHKAWRIFAAPTPSRHTSPRNISGRRGRSAGKRRTGTSGNNQSRSSVPRPMLICRQRPDARWEIVLAADAECCITEVWQNGKLLNMSNGEYSLESFRDLLTVNDTDERESGFPLFTENQHFIDWKQMSGSSHGTKDLVPEFGFVTPLFEKPNKPSGRLSPRLRLGRWSFSVKGRNRELFCICRSCGAHMTEPTKGGKHDSPSKFECRGTLERFSLGHEPVMDVRRLQFPGLQDERQAYSVAYAILLGAAETLNVPNTDLNVTITGVNNSDESTIVLYDNVPGGAGLMAQLEVECGMRISECGAGEEVSIPHSALVIPRPFPLTPARSPKGPSRSMAPCSRHNGRRSMGFRAPGQPGRHRPLHLGESCHAAKVLLPGCR
ncbi:hypothetical protein NKDENANG_00087 [Candidatus Entotheonellaceae bacterium PAL068K]